MSAANRLRLIAIDGPAGSGKSTVSRAVADALDLEVLDTGAMYRAATVAAQRAGLDLEDGPAVSALVARTDIAVGSRVTIDGVDVTEAIRTPEATHGVSLVARIPEVRSLLIDRQREWVQVRGGGVVEGRDMTSVVFPDAPVRVYLHADPAVRAQRRGFEEAQREQAVADRNIEAELARRDMLDSDQGRVLRTDQVPEGVIAIDTSERDVDAVVSEVLRLAEEAAIR